VRIYLVHAKANYASATDGLVNAMREREHPLTLYSFEFLVGRQTLPIQEDPKPKQESPSNV
jgi:hypothetical protein